ncbi:MAG: hypothetical protein AB1643_00535 [Patescibacteria group bacterium]
MEERIVSKKIRKLRIGSQGPETTIQSGDIMVCSFLTKRCMTIGFKRDYTPLICDDGDDKWFFYGDPHTARSIALMISDIFGLRIEVICQDNESLILQFH